MPAEDSTGAVADPTISIQPWIGPSCSPLVTLPPELLSKIFGIWLSICFVDKRPLPWPNTWQMLQTLLQVCHYWRQVVINLRSFWRSIRFDDTIPREAIHTQLKRAGSIIPLCIRIKYPDTRRHIRIVAPELHRVLYMNIDFQSSSLHYGRTYETEALQSLTIQNTAKAAKVGIPFLSLDQPLKLLRCLVVRGVAYRSMSSLFRPTITTLKLVLDDGTRQVGSHATPSQLLGALSKMPLLKTLEIHGLFHPEEPSLDAGPTVSLDRLESCSIICHGRACAELLSHLKIPSRAFIIQPKPACTGGHFRGGCFSDFSASRPSTWNQWDAFPILLPVIAEKLALALRQPLRPSPNTLFVEAKVQQGEVFIALAHNHDTSSVPYVVYQHTGIRRPVSHILEHICTAVPVNLLSGVRTLRLVDWRCSSAHPPISFGRRFDALQHLSLMGCCGILEYMVNYVPAAEEPTADLFPQLQDLFLRKICLNRRDRTQKLITWTRLRVEQGKPLRKLLLNGCSGIMKDNVKGLREFVKMVDWDEKEV
ncbi:hypothetical protein EIP91_003173 [Steccherinum ochraceum]|uniref:Uncharacterized protein n=1 Tax=Steccherinum ochraceum TaxID=92696 RepID=A0A4R0RSA8_9APHY|nr:hypothetical protein EIP91_003173 [Steccherinum ochraceum]